MTNIWVSSLIYLETISIVILLIYHPIPQVLLWVVFGRTIASFFCRINIKSSTKRAGAGFNRCTSPC